MDEPIRTRAEHLGAWAEAASWYGAGLWWCVPPRLPAVPCTSEVPNPGEGCRPHHERAPLTEQEERALVEIEAGLTRVRDDATTVIALSPPASRAGRASWVVLVALLGTLALVAITLLAAGDPVVPVGAAVAIGALLWRRGGRSRSFAQGRRR